MASGCTVSLGTLWAVASARHPGYHISVLTYSVFVRLSARCDLSGNSGPMSLDV